MQHIPQSCYYKKKRQSKSRIPLKIMSSDMLMPANYASATIPPAIPDLFGISLAETRRDQIV